MLEFSKRLGICLGIATAFCLGACGDDDSSTDKGKSNSGGNEVAECENNDDCKDVEGKPFCDPDKKECVEEKKEDDQGGDGSGDGSGDGGGDGDGSSDGSGDGQGDTEGCSEGQEACGSSCVDLKTDSSHCGKCDNACTDGKTCINGECDFACGESTPDKCSDGCYNFQEDPNHCGNCDTKCSDGQSCTAGKCSKGCDEAGQIACGADETCTNVQSDNNNCGECGKVCDPGTSCQGGVCKKSCEAPAVLCENDNQCYDLDSDENCGSCESRAVCDTSKNEHCSSNRICEGPCPDSEKPDQCGDVCVNLKTDPKHCGGCEGDDYICGEKEVCSDGKCVTDCGEGYAEFEGACISKTDPKHCGIGSTERDESIPAGGIDCTALPGVVDVTCENDKCKISQCEDNYTVCESNPTVCTDLRSKETCGSCSNKCEDENADADKTTCKYNAEKPEDSVCQFTCKEGMTSCGGKCLDINKDSNNCGFCGNACGEGAECINGFCTYDPNNCKADADSNMWMEIKIKGQPVKLFCVRTAAELASIANSLNAGNPYPADNKNNNYIIAADIDIGTKTWTSIGTSSKPYSGIFFGNGKEIKGTLSTSGANTGFFGYAKSAMLDGFNLKLEIKKTDSSNYLGALVGYVVNSTINGSKQSGKVEGYANVGGLVGGSEDLTLTHCSSEGSVKTSSDYAAGIAGRITRTTITEAHSSATITSGYRGGGLIGLVKDSTISDSSTSGDVTCSGTATGGLIGWIWSENKDSIVKNCHTSGNQKGVGAVGGLIGYDYGTGLLTVEDSSAAGNVSGTGNGLGGLIGYAANGANHKTIIKRSHASGTVSTATSGALYIGGIVGYLEHGEITDSHFVGEIHKDKTGRSSSGMGGIIGYANDVSMKNVYVNSKGISGSLALGGIAGYLHSNSKVENAWVKADLFSSWARVGGIVGQVDDNSTLETVLYNGKISAIREDGGIAGWLEGAGKFEVNNAAVLGEIEIYEEGNAQLGGFIGLVNGSKTISIRNSYVMATLTNTLAPQHKYVVQYSGGNTTMKNSYNWKEMGSKLSSVDLPQASIYPFVFNDDKDPVVEVGQQKLWEALGSSNWRKGSFNMVTIDNSIPGLPIEKKTLYVVPIPSVFDASILVD